MYESHEVGQYLSVYDMIVSVSGGNAVLGVAVQSVIGQKALMGGG